jgi:hypothetical protein
VGALERTVVQGEGNEVGFVGTNRDTSCANMVLMSHVHTVVYGIVWSVRLYSPKLKLI